MAGFLAGVTKSDLWPIAGGAAVFAVVGLGLLALRRLPKSEPLSCTTVGTELSVGGGVQTVNAGEGLRVGTVYTLHQRSSARQSGLRGASSTTKGL